MRKRELLEVESKRIRDYVEQQLAWGQVQDILAWMGGQAYNNKGSVLFDAGGREFDVGKLLLIPVSCKDMEPDNDYEYDRKEWIFILDNVKFRINAFYDSWGETDKDSISYQMEPIEVC